MAITKEATLEVGQWVVLVGEDIATIGETEEEATERARELGLTDFTVARVVQPGIYAI